MMLHRTGASYRWAEWADWLLGGSYPDRPDRVEAEFPEDQVSETYFGTSLCDALSFKGTTAERALYAYFLAEAGEPF